MKEIPLKQWVLEEAARSGVTAGAIHNRLCRGRYPELKLRRINSRLVFVQLPENGDGKHPLPTHEQWRAIQEAAGPGGVHAEAIPDLIRRDREAFGRLQDCVQRHRLGLGAENVDVLVVAELDRLASLISSRKRESDLFHVPQRTVSA